MTERLRESFFRWGWLMPVVFPLAEVGGRGLFNSLAGIYALWGLGALAGRRPLLDATALASYGLLLLAFLASVAGSADPAAAFKGWLVFALHTLAFAFTLAALQGGSTLSRLFTAYGAAGLLTLGILYAMLLWQANLDPAFEPTRHMKEDNLPFLAPFMIWWLWKRMPPGGRRWGASVMVALAVLAYVVMSEGRAALAGLLMAGALGAWLLGRWPRWKVMALIVVVVAAALAGNGERLVRGSQEVDGDWGEVLDRFSSHRLSIWLEAVRHPPASPWTGIGIGQVKHAPIAGGLDPFTARHFHNFLIDTWYETGFLGLAGLAGFLGLMLWRGAAVWRRSAGEVRLSAGVLLAAAAAVLTAALFSFSYASRQFSLYLFVLFGAMQYLWWKQSERSGP